jgi:pimeloyl-ACP methyl ester carboxylesterase
MVNEPSTDVTARWTELEVEAGAARLHVHRAGRPDRPALVLAHGLGDSGRCWWRVAAALEDHADLVMIDARHHGRSSSPAASSSSLTDDLAVVVDALDLGRPAFVGHSVGARTAAQFAATHPGRTARLVLIDPPWTSARELDGDVRASEREAIRGWLGSFADMTDADLAALGRQHHPDWPDSEYATWIESKRQVQPDAADDLSTVGWGSVVGAIDCPTLLVHGEPDRGGIVTDEVARRIVELNDRVTCVRLDGTGHNIHREDFEGFIDVVRGFLFDDAT